MAHTRFEGRWPGAYIVSDDIHLSREVVTFAAGAVIEPGTVLGCITASGEYTPLEPAASNGAEQAAAIAYGHVDASAATVSGVVTFRQSAVKRSELIWPEGITEAQKAKASAELTARTIIQR